MNDWVLLIVFIVSVSVTVGRVYALEGRGKKKTQVVLLISFFLLAVGGMYRFGYIGFYTE